VLKVLKNLVLSPRLWLTAGVFSMFASVLLGYHQNQLDAESALAQKIAVPERVVVQEFSSSVNENELGEIHVLAEAAVDKAVRIDIGREGAPHLMDVVPIYPVSRQSFPVAQSLLNKQRRPVARADAAKIAQHGGALKRIEGVPVGLMVFEADAESMLPDLQQLERVQGLTGPLVDLAGKRIENAIILKRATDLLGRHDVALIEDALLVSPYLQGRNQRSGVNNFVTLQKTLFWASLLMIAFGMASLFSLLPSIAKRKPTGTSDDAKTAGPFSVASPFQPIAGQDEIGDDAKDSKTGRSSRVLTIASHVFRTKSRP
jgi:hypothetical protein